MDQEDGLIKCALFFLSFEMFSLFFGGAIKKEKAGK